MKHCKSCRGRPGSAVVQIVDSGSWATFDCHMTAFSKITDYNTGFFPVSYEEVPCDTASQGPVVGVLQYDPWLKKKQLLCRGTCQLPFLLSHDIYIIKHHQKSH